MKFPSIKTMPSDGVCAVMVRITSSHMHWTSSSRCAVSDTDGRRLQHDPHKLENEQAAGWLRGLTLAYSHWNYIHLVDPPQAHPARLRLVHSVDWRSLGSHRAKPVYLRARRRLDPVSGPGSHSQPAAWVRGPITARGRIADVGPSRFARAGGRAGISQTGRRRETPACSVSQARGMPPA